MKVPLIWLQDYIDTSKSAKELAASFTQLGLMLDKPLDKSNVLDLEHRMDRSDWLSLIGCARDLAAFEDIKLKMPKLYTKPGKILDSKSKIQVKVDTPAVKRFQTRIFKGIKVGESPAWLRDRLTAYGMDSINNIVDITNFVMVEYGQTMHAQDIAKLKGRDITIRPAKTGEKLTTILGTEIKLDSSVFILTSGGEPTVIGGIVGGKNTGVTATTTDMVLDSGSYDSRTIRRISRKLKILNESVSRNDKFLDPRAIDLALARATDLILELAGGTYYENDDYYPSPVLPKSMTLRLSRLHLISGMDITMPTAKKILKSLEYSIIEEGEGSLTVEIPYFRTDIEVEDDLVSDILRIYNYTHIPTQPLSSPVPLDITPPIYRFEESLRDLLIAQGDHEHITSSLVNSCGSQDEVVLANALSSDQNALRTHLTPGLVHVLSTYSKHKQTNVSVFEIGKVFRKSTNKYLEGRLLTLASNASVSDSLATLLSSLGIRDYQINSKHEILVSDQLVGTIESSSYTLVTNTLMPLAKSYTGIISEFDHSTSLDLSLLSPTKVIYTDILQALSSLKVGWNSITCKSMTKMTDTTNNYLLTITWDADSQSVESDKNLILQTLKEKLNIDSNS
jgi:phenylalanyl-tRNA synthetase beta chain